MHGRSPAECKPEPGMHAVLCSPSAGLDALRRNIMMDFDIHEESQTTAEVPVTNSSTSHNVSGSPPHTRTPDLALEPAACTNINNVLTDVINSCTDSEETDTVIKKKSKYVPLLYKNRIILGKINVPEANQNHEKEKCLLAVVVTDCMESLLRSERYCAACAVLFPTRPQYYQHCVNTHKQAPPARARRPRSLRIKNKTTRTNLTCGSCLPMHQPHIHKNPHSGTGRYKASCKSCNKAFKLHPTESILKALSSRAASGPPGEQLPEQSLHKQNIANLEKDVQFVHQPEKPNECKTCKKRIRHELSECSNCIKNRKPTRNNHTLQPHDHFIRISEKPNECKTCKKRISHELSECSNCIKNRKPTRNNHTLQPHDHFIRISEKPNECKTCKKRIRQDKSECLNCIKNRKATRNNLRINTHDLKSRLNQQFIQSHLRRWKHAFRLDISAMTSAATE
ncbi:hypothetical protein JYU34_022022 [Plutella xylostella]|uniref:C2H2-type domain-containing protein n=1 Tax=Plutella xylostella TaxID=51655 RepID=A0ABQ7PQ28_PLUXY|nr:hypothetical protein JYU34_022022 [Plutella xylostella]